MSSADFRRRSQSGQSLVEILVASALMGIALVVGLTAIDSAQAGARRVVREAWAQCAVRTTADAIQASAWESGGGAYSGMPGVAVLTVGPPGGSASDLQAVTITANWPAGGPQLFQTQLLKSYALRGQEPFAQMLPRIKSACPQP